MLPVKKLILCTGGNGQVAIIGNVKYVVFLNRDIGDIGTKTAILHDRWISTVVNPGLHTQIWTSLRSWTHTEWTVIPFQLRRLDSIAERSFNGIDDCNGVHRGGRADHRKFGTMMTGGEAMDQGLSPPLWARPQAATASVAAEVGTVLPSAADPPIVATLVRSTATIFWGSVSSVAHASRPGQPPNTTTLSGSDPYTSRVSLSSQDLARPAVVRSKTTRQAGAVGSIWSR